MTAYVNGAKITGTSTKVDTSGATATAANIESGYTAWVNGELLNGSLAKGYKIVSGTTQNLSTASSQLSVTVSSLSSVAGMVIYKNYTSSYGSSGSYYYIGADTKTKSATYLYSSSSSASLQGGTDSISCTISGNNVKFNMSGNRYYLGQYIYIAWGE